MPPTPPSAPPDATFESPAASEVEDASIILSADDDQRAAGEPLAGVSGEEPGKAESEPEAAPEPEPLAPSAPLASEEPAISAPEASAEAAEPAAPEPEQRAPRGRFERFYAPGQSTRATSNGRPSAPERNGKSPGGHPAESDADNGHGRHAPPTPEPSRAPLPHTSHSGAEDDEALIATGPREDVRGAVGGLIDSLHDLFVHDRALASQGGVSRCGICYLHYPLGELVYHESEGFYVCQPCERALSGARVNMVRRQQRL